MAAKNRARSYRNLSNNYKRQHWRKIQARTRYRVSWQEEGATCFDYFSVKEEGITWRKLLESRKHDGDPIDRVTGPERVRG